LISELLFDDNPPGDAQRPIEEKKTQLEFELREA